MRGANAAAATAAAYFVAPLPGTRVSAFIETFEAADYRGFTRYGGGRAPPTSSRARAVNNTLTGLIDIYELQLR